MDLKDKIYHVESVQVDYLQPRICTITLSCHSSVLHELTKNQKEWQKNNKLPPRMWDAEEIEQMLWRLDWREILKTAIDSRPTSWYPLGFVRHEQMPPSDHYYPAEWRNSSDELNVAVVNAMRKIMAFNPWREAIEDVKSRDDQKNT